ncbi:MAG: hypothetical protein HUU21_00330 [Polyangiaceae bacterium]|nr:hypothetical protein [Polyangiaceae bacterium]
MSHDAAEELAKLVEETERVARQAEDMRVRIAAAKRRPTSDEVSADSGAASSEVSGPRAVAETDKAPVPPSERIPCLDTVSKLLPSLNKPRRSPPDSGVFSLVAEPGRYSIIAHRRERGSHVDLPMPVPKTKVSA